MRNFLLLRHGICKGICMSEKDAAIAALIEAAESFAKIEVPAIARDTTWVAQTIFCNDQITAFQVLKLRNAIDHFKNLSHN